MIQKILHSKKLERIKRFIGIKTGVYLKLKRFTCSASDELRTATIINSKNIDLVIDIGANTGQFAESLIDFGYEKEIISFEPVLSCYDVLLKRSSNKKNWKVAERCAIGEKDGKTNINISKNTVFSSVLKIEDWHSSSKSQSEVINTEEVPIFQLDSILDKYVDDLKSKRILLKIDTQGYEKQVLSGAQKLLKELAGIKIEIPLNPIYQNVEFSFYETLKFLEKEGFVPYSFNNEGVNLNTGRVNTIDGLFIKDTI